MSKKTKIILCAALAVLVALFCAASLLLSPEANEGDKHIVFEATGLDGTAKSFDIQTDAETLAEMLKASCGVKTVVIGYVGAVIGSHSGPGTLALFFLGSHR